MDTESVEKLYVAWIGTKAGDRRMGGPGFWVRTGMMTITGLPSSQEGLPRSDAPAPEGKNKTSIKKST